MATTSPPWRRGKRVGGERHGDRAPAGGALEPRELVGRGDDRRGALGRLLVQHVEALALALGSRRRRARSDPSASTTARSPGPGP